MVKFIYRLFLLFTIILYVSPFFSPENFWILGLASFLILPILAIHILVFVGCLIKARKHLLLPMIAVIIGLPYLFLSLGTKSPPKRTEGLTVLSYNVRVFNVYKHLNTNYESSKRMIDWIKFDNSDIKCLQEFHNQSVSDIFETRAILTDKKRYQAYIKPQTINHLGHEFGLAIFSKHPIINKGLVVFEKSNYNNNAIYIDIVYKHDTIRVYNAHLESMSIDKKSIGEEQNIKSLVGNVLDRLKLGLSIRAIQVKELVQHMENCPYPIILASDLNELPYSYVYRKIKSTLNNSFEKAGFGLGITYNGSIPFLRIDNLFSSNELETLDFKTENTIKYSDHFPIKGVYRIKDN